MELPSPNVLRLARSKFRKLIAEDIDVQVQISTPDHSEICG